MPKIPKVILLIDTARAYGRGLLSGIAKYSHLHSPWVFCWKAPFYREPAGKELTLSQLKAFGADGIIMREQKKTEEILAMGLPTIVSPYTQPFPGLPNILIDDVATGEMAAKYLLNRGFRHFAFCGFQDMLAIQCRGEAFCKSVAEAGFQTHIYKEPKSRVKRLWENEQMFMANWLKSLPRPVALMAGNDDRARQVMETCKIAGLHVPEEVAVIGVDNDELVCDLSDPPLSSIALNFERSGYEAAQLLDKLMAGEKMANQRIVVRPIHIVTRRSTDILAIEDNDIAEAVRFIHQHARESIQVSDVVEVVALSRRSFYKRFRRALGCSPNEEIRRVRVEQITRMLIETNLSVSQIALALGYPGVAHIARYFRREKGLSLLEYRRQYGRK